MALIDSQPRMATARASSDTTVNTIPREAIKARLDKLEKFDPVLRRLMGMFVDRMRDFRFISADS
jgi:CRP-like cAMP-binding protein